MLPEDSDIVKLENEMHISVMYIMCMTIKDQANIALA